MSVTTVTITEVQGRPVETSTDPIVLQSLLNSVSNRLQHLTVARQVLPCCKNTADMPLGSKVRDAVITSSCELEKRKEKRKGEHRGKMRGHN